MRYRGTAGYTLMDHRRNEVEEELQLPPVSQIKNTHLKQLVHTYFKKELTL